MKAFRSEISPRTLARIGGLLYLIIIVIGLWEEMFVRGSIVVAGDAVATAANLRSRETLWRLGIAGEYVLLSSAIALTAIFYILFRPVSRRVALLAVLFNLVSIAVEAVAGMGLLAALWPLGETRSLAVFTPEQLAALSSLCIRWHSYGFGVALLFFGIECLILGYLVRKSGFIPAVIGVLMQIAGVCYLVNSFALIAAPAMSSALFPWVLLPSFVGEASLCGWLLVREVRFSPSQVSGGAL